MRVISKPEQEKRIHKLIDTLLEKTPKRDRTPTVFILGAGGFIGGHMARYFETHDVELVCFDKKQARDWYQWCENYPLVKNFPNNMGDVREDYPASIVAEYSDIIFNFACEMGGMGFIHNHQLETGLSTEIHISLIKNLLKRDGQQPHIIYSSSACVYPETIQMDETSKGYKLKESDAIPAQPDLLYGWEKLYAERLWKAWGDTSGGLITIARLHNIGGEYGTYDGGREKAPAAACRKFAKASLEGLDNFEVEIWGDGDQTRSFMYVDDMIEATLALAISEYQEPVNIGSEEGISVNDLYSLVSSISEVNYTPSHDLSKPVGVRHRNADCSLLRELTGFIPEWSYEEWLTNTYTWIKGQLETK